MLLSVIGLAACLVGVQACDSCYGPEDHVQHKRLVPRMQPEALNATVSPRKPLEWGQINFLQTTDTHGWLEGHLKEQSYGADWGDFASFVKHMRKQADHLDVDLLLVDTGDLHDGAGLSDATDPNGLESNPVFQKIDYDLLTIGNHELYVTDIAYETFANFSKVYGDRYLTSNVDIINKATGQYEPIGHRYRYFKTKQGLRIMAFGVLFDFTGNSNVSRVTKTKEMVQQSWFTEALHYKEPIDLFVVIGHNPVRANDSSSTFGTLYNTIRSARPDVPIQAFGGHTHIRDFTVYDEMSTGLESGRYCETLGWLAMSGVQSDTFKGAMYPKGVPNPSRRAIRSNSTSTNSSLSATHRPGPKKGYLYARRYLDWNRLTFAYHAKGSQDGRFDTPLGQKITSEITGLRTELNISYVYGCAPETYCATCKPFMAEGNIFKLLDVALKQTIVNDARADRPRLILINTGSIRFDLVQGPFTVDDSYIVSPFKNNWEYIPDVPYAAASQVIGILNAGAYQKRSVDAPSHHFLPRAAEVCTDSEYSYAAMTSKRDGHGSAHFTRRRDTTELTAGYVTTDDFGSDGDDTVHSAIPYYAQPNDLQANASFPTDGSLPDKVDLVFLDFIGSGYVVPALQQAGASYTASDIQLYLPEDVTSNQYLAVYASKNWSAGMPNCPVGAGVQ